MKTVKEIAQKQYGASTVRAVFDMNEVEVIAKEYAREACREQRALCSSMYRPGYDGQSIRFDIYNAPEPEME